jgi:hypothetical protein
MAFGDHVKVKLGLDSKGFNQGLSNAQAKAQKFGSSFKSGFVGAIGTAVIARASQQIIDFGASIGDLEDRVGISAEFLQKMQFSAEQNGSSAEQASKAIMRLGKSIGDAKDGLSTAVRAFDRAGVTFNNTDGSLKSIEQVAYDLADGLKAMTDDGERVKVAFDLMGRSGLAMTQFMYGGAESMKAFGERAEKLGFILSNDNVRALQDASGELEKLGRQVKVFGARILPPLFEKFKAFVGFVQEAIKVIKPFGKELMQAGMVIASYWATGKVVAGLKIVAGGFLLIGNAIRKATGAVVALNIASMKNPFGLLVASAVVLYPLIRKITNGTEELQRKLDEVARSRISIVNDKIDDLTKQTASAVTQMQLLKEEMIELQGTPSLPLSEQLSTLRKQRGELEKIIGLKDDEMTYEMRVLEGAQKMLKELKAKQKSGVEDLKLQEEIAKATQFVAELQAGITQRELEQTKAKKELLEIDQESAEVNLKLRNEVEARRKGLQLLLTDQKAEVVELDKANRRTEALRKGGLEQLAVVDRQLKIEAKIRALLKDKKMSLTDAQKLAIDLVDATDEQARVAKEINDLNEQQKIANEEQKRIIEEKIKKLEEERKLHAENQRLVDQSLSVLRLRARGNDDLANLLQSRIDNEKKILEIQKNQGLNLGGAVAQRREELVLLARINALENTKQKEQLIGDAVKFQANRKLGDAVDKTDKNRIRKAKEIERIEKRLEFLKKQGNRQEAIENLTKRKNKLLELVLDDQTKKQIEALDNKRVELKKEFDAQLKSLELAEKKVREEQAKFDAKREGAVNEIIKEGQNQQRATRAILSAGEKAIRVAGETMAQSLKAVKLNPQNNNAPIQPQNAVASSGVAKTTRVFVENQLSQTTQDKILKTLGGYFVSQ